MRRFRSRYRAGDWVEVRSSQEILATLDADGCLDKLPFMPEMQRYCGQRFQVFASAHKTCDTIQRTGGRRMRDAVHLEDLRCDGSAHGGCQARCSIFWKEAWLKPASAEPSATDRAVFDASASSGVEQKLNSWTRHPPGDATESPVYVCQATRLLDATTPLPAWSPMQYVADIRSGNERPLEAAKVLLLHMIFSLREIRRGHRLWHWLYDRAHRWMRGTESPYATGTVPRGASTPDIRARLEIGTTVRVKSHRAVLQTLDGRNRNRGLLFDKEMVRYCGQDFRVIGHVERIIDEATGKMLQMARPSVVLEGTYCTSRYSERRLLCPRRLTPFWREAWLCRVDAPSPEPEHDTGAREP